MKGVWACIMCAKFESAERGGSRQAEEKVPNREGKKEAELANGERSNLARARGGVWAVMKVENDVAQALRVR